ncbi:hypothetical protein [Hoyosella altamirensis]|uniref:Uncharacterized protein n=1 Tax=Hoyosella altamirensis TaxID=616997 RepID=A0A839RM37_9ACTN|nr:hypothetical protein [Hoyosella altamirensis]MBB3037011.1 hypothetical protein [Hoyosella altamirensis]
MTTIDRTQTHRRRIIIGAGLAALALTGTAVGLAGAAHAAIPDYPATITMSITNNTDHTMYLHGSDNPYGDWIQAPTQTIGPHETETVSASTWNQNGFAIDATYGISGTNSEAVYFANNYPGAQTDTQGTRIDGDNTANLGINSAVTTGAPYMVASYTLTNLLG